MVLRFQFYAITLHKEKKNVLKNEIFLRFIFRKDACLVFLTAYRW